MAKPKSAPKDLGKKEKPGAALPKRVSRKYRAVKKAAAARSLTDGVVLRNGVVMPAVGFGTYKMKGVEATTAVLQALQCGYRSIDTAEVYGNEAHIRKAIEQSEIPREELFVVTKVWRTQHGYERTLKAFNESLKKLGLDYIDLYLIHWPGAKTGWPLKRGDIRPVDWTPAMRNTDTWRALEELHDSGRAKAIGVCNYSIRHLEELLATCRIKPMINQVEFHPKLVQGKLLEFCQTNGIQLQAYASLGSGDNKNAGDFFKLPPVVKAAEKHKKTPAQVLLRWALQKGAVVIPKSSKMERMVENAQVFDFSLTPTEVKALDALNEGKRFAWNAQDPEDIL